MTASELPTNGTTPAAASSYKFILANFVAAILVSAALLFAVEPMFTKMVLPRLGGAAAVWSVAMVFFQAALLAGYSYAHLLTRFGPGRKSVGIHLTVMVVACFALPLHIAAGWGRPPATGEAFWLLGLFTVSIGLPFFALAANGPLLQAWFMGTDHPAAKNPYFLYAASNAGSFLALISYPLVIEPFTRLGEQTWTWTIGFYGLILLITGCGALLLRSTNGLPNAATAEAGGITAITEDAASPTWRDAAIWAALAAVPSGLLIAVTAHISTDVAAVPLLWVLPLALYLLTFVIVFQTRPLIPHRLVVAVQPVFILALVVVLIISLITSIIVLIALHLIVFFVCALLCHGELARRRPAPRHLTAYFMWISAGGMIGGISAALIAPHVFTWIAEYPLLIVLAALCRPGLSLPAWRSGQYPLFAALAAAAAMLISVKLFDLNFDYNLFNMLIGVLLGLTAAFWRVPLPFAAIVAFLLFANHYFTAYPTDYTVRNFFGVLSVTDTSDGRFRVLWHGTTGQGSQRIRDDEGNPVIGRPEMIAEFFAGAGIAQVFDMMHARGPIDYAVIGLGTGTLACQRGPRDSLTYYEIDPDIVRIARDPKLFNYISDCAPDVPIVLGDARLRLADAPDGSYDMIFVDAFIGAAIPLHLLTREAMALYLRKLKPHGIVAMHVSNYNLELASVAAGIAEANGAIARVYDGGDVEEDANEQHWVPRVAAIARRDADFGALVTSPFWPIRKRDPNQRVWTDDYSNVFGAILRKMREKNATRSE
jgi:hypothetical protein